MKKLWDRWLDSVNPYRPERIRAQGGTAIDIEDTAVRRRLVRIVLLAFAAFLVWAFVAPIDSGVTLPGSVVVYGSRKAVQHPSGGVVSRILVREGSPVRQGDVLVQLNPLGIQANLSSAELEYISALAMESRLAAERDAQPIRWMPELEQMGGDPRVVEAEAMQRALLESRRRDLGGQKRILEEQLDGYGRQLAELRNIMDVRRKQLEIISDEARNVGQLASEGYVPRSKANESERNRNEVLASLATSNSETSRLLATIAATRLQLTQIEVAFRKEVDGQLADVQKNRKSLRDRVDSLRFDLSLAELKAPVDGTVVAMKVATEGGVIQGGQVLMEIVPRDSALIVEARIPPATIDKMHVGLDADMRFSAFNMTTTPIVPGRVKLVGADRIVEQGQPDGYYLAQVEPTADGRTLLGDKQIQPGMPVEVIVKTGERTFMSYLVKPITDRFARAFKEN